jgi:hypothetical protein
MSNILDPRSLLLIALVVVFALGGLAVAQNPEYRAALNAALEGGRAEAYDLVVYAVPETLEHPPVDLPPLKDHPIERHGAWAIQVDNCLRANGREAEFLNPETGRWYLPCKLPTGKYGIGIYERIERAGKWVWENVTAYPTRYITLRQVWKYLESGNVLRIEP